MTITTDADGHVRIDHRSLGLIAAFDPDKKVFVCVGSGYDWFSGYGLDAIAACGDWLRSNIGFMEAELADAKEMLRQLESASAAIPKESLS